MDEGDDDTVMQKTRRPFIKQTWRPIEPDLERVVHGPVNALGRSTPPARLGMVDGDRSAPLNGVAQAAGWDFKYQDPTSREASLFATDVADQLSVASSLASMTSSSGQSDEDMNGDMATKPSPAPLTNLRTGLCYDTRMRYHCELQPERDDYHPEDPRRIFSIFQILCLAGLVDDVLATLRPLVDKPLLRIAARKATIAEICLVHDRKHVDFVESTKDLNEDQLIEISKQWDSIYFNTQTFFCASLSAGGVIDSCRAAASGQVKNAIAIVRPPGHHAECNRSMGFCFFDNVSIAAKVCQIDFGEACRKILIVDWDVHHGNGIQQAFWEDPNVLYISIHVHNDGNFYPPGQYGDHLHCGHGNGLGKNINIPWPMQGMGNADYLYAFQQIVMPVAFEFNPDLVIVAAGFDAAAGDQLGLCFVTPACYAHMTHMLMSLAGGKVVCCLEGGYNLDAIADSALAVTRTLMGEPPDRIPETSPTKSAVTTVQKVALVQSEYWHCLRPKNIGKHISQMRGAERLHDVIRSYQAAQLLENHKMITLMVYHNKLSRSFENEILATSTYRDRVPLIVIFHDPPEIHGIIDPETQKLALHNLYLTDVAKNYIKWATDHKYSVIDVNVPRHVTQDEHGYQEEAPAERARAAEEMSIYLWENYIEPYHATDIFFFGFGTCYQAPLYLLSARESFRRRVTGLISFVPHDLIPINDASIDRLAKWYYQNSLVILPHSHAVFDPERVKRPSKRFGNLIRSEEEELQAMLVKEMGRVWEFVEGKIEM